MGTIKDISDKISNILSGGTAGIALKISLFVLLLAAVWFINKWAKEKKIAEAREKEQKQAIEDQKNIVDKNQKENEDLQKDSKASDDFLNSP